MKTLLLVISFLFMSQVHAGAKSNVDLFKTVERVVEDTCKESGDKKEVSKCMSNWQAMMKKDCSEGKNPWDSCFFDTTPRAKYKSSKNSKWVDVVKELKN